MVMHEMDKMYFDFVHRPKSKRIEGKFSEHPFIVNVLKSKLMVKRT